MSRLSELRIGESRLFHLIVEDGKKEVFTETNLKRRRRILLDFLLHYTDLSRNDLLMQDIITKLREWRHKGEI